MTPRKVSEPKGTSGKARASLPASQKTPLSAEGGVTTEAEGRPASAPDALHGAPSGAVDAGLAPGPGVGPEAEIGDVFDLSSGDIADSTSVAAPARVPGSTPQRSVQGKSPGASVVSPRNSRPPAGSRVSGDTDLRVGGGRAGEGEVADGRDDSRSGRDGRDEGEVGPETTRQAMRRAGKQARDHAGRAGQANQESGSKAQNDADGAESVFSTLSAERIEGLSMTAAGQRRQSTGLGKSSSGGAAFLGSTGPQEARKTAYAQSTQNTQDTRDARYAHDTRNTQDPGDAQDALQSRGASGQPEAAEIHKYVLPNGFLRVPPSDPFSGAMQGSAQGVLRGAQHLLPRGLARGLVVTSQMYPNSEQQRHESQERQTLIEFPEEYAVSLDSSASDPGSSGPAKDVSPSHDAFNSREKNPRAPLSEEPFPTEIRGKCFRREREDPFRKRTRFGERFTDRMRGLLIPGVLTQRELVQALQGLSAGEQIPVFYMDAIPTDSGSPRVVMHVLHPQEADLCPSSGDLRLEQLRGSSLRPAGSGVSAGPGSFGSLGGLGGSGDPGAAGPGPSAGQPIYWWRSPFSMLPRPAPSQFQQSLGLIPAQQDPLRSRKRGPGLADRGLLIDDRPTPTKPLQKVQGLLDEVSDERRGVTRRAVRPGGDPVLSIARRRGKHKRPAIALQALREAAAGRGSDLAWDEFLVREPGRVAESGGHGEAGGVRVVTERAREFSRLQGVYQEVGEAQPPPSGDRAFIDPSEAEALETATRGAELGSASDLGVSSLRRGRSSTARVGLGGQESRGEDSGSQSSHNDVRPAARIRAAAVAGESSDSNEISEASEPKSFGGLSASSDSSDSTSHDSLEKLGSLVGIGRLESLASQETLERLERRSGRNSGRLSGRRSLSRSKRKASGGVSAASAASTASAAPAVPVSPVAPVVRASGAAKADQTTALQRSPASTAKERVERQSGPSQQSAIYQFGTVSTEESQPAEDSASPAAQEPEHVRTMGFTFSDGVSPAPLAPPVPAPADEEAAATGFARITAAQLPEGYPRVDLSREETVEALQALASCISRLSVSQLFLGFEPGSFAFVFWGICEALRSCGVVSFVHLRKLRRSQKGLYKTAVAYLGKATPEMLTQMLDKKVNDWKNTHICAVHCVAYGELAGWDAFKALTKLMHLDSDGKRIARRGLFQKIRRLQAASMASSYGLDLYAESRGICH